MRPLLKMKKELPLFHFCHLKMGPNCSAFRFFNTFLYHGFNTPHFFFFILFSMGGREEEMNLKKKKKQ